MENQIENGLSQESIDVSENPINSEKIQKDILEIEKEKDTIVHLSYLSTLSRLADNRDLSNLFDGEINL
jgi:poly(3-hydroxyalkanoate) synthetase